MTATQPASAPLVDNPGLDGAVDILTQYARIDPNDTVVTQALTFLEILIPADHPTHPLAHNLCKALRALRSIGTTDSGGDSPLNTLGQTLKAALTFDPVRIQVLRTAEHLEAFQREHGLRGDWHEPDEQNITTRVTLGSFDNCSSSPYHLEQSVIFMKTDPDLERVAQPIAAANLALLCAWATGLRS